MVLEGNTLSPRLEALFRTREARALALGGDQRAAERSYRKAHTLYLDGVRDDDPMWAWWINDQELAWHHAMIQADSADWNSAVDTFHTSVEDLPATVVRGRYCHLAYLLDAQVRAAAWSDATQTIERIMPFVDEVGSTRTAATLLGAINELDTSPATTPAQDAARQLRAILTDAGYGH